jgi:predicted NUDIX family phosphoesterase
MEHVLVIPRSLFDSLGSFQGFHPDAPRYLPALLDTQNNFFMERPAAEIDCTHKQLIPYSIFHHAGRYLCYTRGGKSGEKRLVAKRSIGIGGRI